ncbi:putative methyltransferase type 11, S-adenosyl-L-methionine-dependent methyltransferase [Dioscorea sansibarensis]
MPSMEDYHPKKPLPTQTPTRTKLKILLLIISTNLLSIYLFSGGPNYWKNYAPRIHLWDTDLLLHELNSTQSKLTQSQRQLSDLHRRLATSNSLLESLLSDLGRVHGDKASTEELDGWRDELFGELKLAVGPHKLPLGFTANLGSDEIFPALGSACRRHQEELIEYMTYDVGGECPSDDVFAQRLMLKGCEPLPRRRCHPASPKGYVEPVPFPESLWTIPPDTSITWNAYTCKNYSCLVHRNREKGSYDCKDCFDLNGREKVRWLFENGGLDYGIDSVLSLRKPGTVRIGLDIGGGSGTFAARMRERNVTIVTSTMNFDGPFNSFIASRGLVPMHVSVANRLPFFDNTLDIVHSMHVLSNWIPDIMLEFALFDIYRVLRPGGLFWLDHFFCIGTQLNTTYVPMFDRIGFNKLRWTAGRKLDRGIEKNEWYLSALLEKPMT